MSAQHVRPLGAYLCVALVAALLLAQSLAFPRSLPGASGVLGGVSTVEVGLRFVVSPLQGDHQLSAQGTVARRTVAEEPAVLTAATPAAAPARRESRVGSLVRRPREASAQVAAGTNRTRPHAKASAPAAQPKADRPAKSKGKARGTSPREARVTHRSWFGGKTKTKTKAKGKSGAKGNAKGKGKARGRR